jgi:hypothetical protein
VYRVNRPIELSALSTVALTATASYLADHHTGPLAPAIAATRGYTAAFAIAATILGLGVILAIVLLPSRAPARRTQDRRRRPRPGPRAAAGAAAGAAGDSRRPLQLLAGDKSRFRRGRRGGPRIPVDQLMRSH